MSNLSEVSEFTTTVKQIDDGEDVDHIVLNGAPQALANRTKYLNDTKAPIDSPTFTGTPQCPTPANTVTSAQLINAAFYANQKGTATPSAAAESGTPGASTKFAREDHTHPANMSSSAADMQMNGTAAAGTSSKPARADHVHPTDSTRAPINSPVFTGMPEAPTAVRHSSSNQIATTLFVFNYAVPAGTIIYTACTTPPAGYLKANGAAISRFLYSGLFSAIGTTFGAGDGVSTFQLPDLRGVFLRGYDDYRGLDAGRLLGSYQDDAIQNITGSFGMDDRGTIDPATGAFYYSIVTNTGSEGGGLGHRVIFDASRVARTSVETRPKNVALLACIKY